MKHKINKRTQILLALTCIVGSLPAFFWYLSNKSDPVAATGIIGLVTIGVSLILGCLLVISFAVEHGKVNRRDLGTLFITGFLGIVGGILWFLLWVHNAPESTGHYYATLNTVAIATLALSVCAAVAVVIRRRKLYRHVLVFLIPFCLISVQWMLYSAWWERSGLWY